MTDLLAPAYRRALELAAAGAGPAAIAADLDVPVESIPMLLRIARAKARRIGSRGAPPDGGTGPDEPAPT